MHTLTPSTISFFDNDVYASKLRDKYHETLLKYKDPNINKFPAAGPSVLVDVPFVLLKLIRVEKHSTENAEFFNKASIEQILEKFENIEIDDILKPLKYKYINGRRVTDKPLRFVLIAGEPGIGKSTLAKELVLRWVRKTDKFLNDYKIVILIMLRHENSQNAKTIEDLVIDVEDINMAEITSLIKRAKGAGVLWILDGFDELPHHLRNSSTLIFNKLIKGDILPKSTVIVTSRHAASSRLLTYMYLDKDSKSIHLLGFSPNEIREYATKYFEGNETLASEFHSYYSHNTMIEMMLYNPMTCFI
uniref:NACHT domain-containing protein n=1 Tax=Amphimedon queenslandica TaxID=400682 RepID=A0A1X7SMI6_AMPQE